MDKKEKTECNNQWAGANTTLTSKADSKQKDENNNKSTFTLKKSREMYEIIAIQKNMRIKNN